MRELHSLLNSYEDLESFIYIEELNLLNKGLQIYIPFRCNDNAILNNFFKVFSLNEVTLGTSFLRRNFELKFKLFEGDVICLQGRIKNRKIFNIELPVKEQLLLPALNFSEQLQWWSNNNLQVSVTLKTKGQARCLCEENEFIFNSEKYLGELFLKSKIEFASHKRQNYDHFTKAAKQRFGQIVDYTLPLFDNISLVKSLNIVEIRHIWSNVWVYGIFFDKVQSNEEFLDKCRLECKELNGILETHYSYLSNFEAEYGPEKPDIFTKTIFLFRLLLNPN